MPIPLPEGKRYYRISEVAEHFGLNASTLRHWEEQFGILKPLKNQKGDRRYLEKDLRVVQRLHTLLKEEGLSIKLARERLCGKKKDKNELVIEKLKQLKHKLEKIAKEL